MDQPPTVATKDCRHGRMMYFPHDRFVGRSLDVYGEYVELEARTLAQLVGPGQTAVEVGANLGAHTVLLGKLVGPAGAVLAFEPQRAMYYLLCANLALNDQFRVNAVRAAVGISVGRISVPVLDHRQEANFGGVSLNSPGPAEDVPLTTIDNLRLSALHLLKVDVEGMEADVLDGARQTIGRWRPILYVENDRREKSSQVIGTLQQLGYDLYWDLPPLFNPDNFFGQKTNVFGGYISINLLCLPSERKMAATGFRRVSGPGDWWDPKG